MLIMGNYIAACGISMNLCKRTVFRLSKRMCTIAWIWKMHSYQIT